MSILSKFVGKIPVVGHALNERRARSDVLAQSPRGERRGIQIGPRIRVGGTVGKIGQNVKNTVTKAATDVGHTVGDVASNPWVQGALAAGLAATGVGAPAAAAIMAATKGGGALLKPGGNIGDAAKGAVAGAAEGYGAGKLGGILKGASVAGKLKGLVTGGGTDGVGNLGVVGDIAGKVGGAVGSGVGLSGSGGGGGFSLSSLVDPALGGLSLYNASKLGQKSSDLADSALKTANESYDTRAPLRLSGIEGMLHPEAGNAAKLSGVNATIGRGNPFAAKPQPIPLSGVR